MENLICYKVGIYEKVYKSEKLWIYLCVDSFMFESLDAISTGCYVKHPTAIR